MDDKYGSMTEEEKTTVVLRIITWAQRNDKEIEKLTKDDLVDALSSRS